MCHPCIIKVLCIILSILFEGLSDFSNKMRYLHIPELDGKIFNGGRTETTVKTNDECALLCLRTKYCNTFSISDTQCFTYSSPYAFLNSPTTLNNAKTYRSVFDFSHQVCDGNFTFDPNGKLCFLFMDGLLNMKTWNEAFLACLELDSVLAILDTEEKLSQYIQLIQSLGLTTTLWWTGGLDASGQNNNWTWLNGQPVNDSLWLPNEPSYSYERCTEFRSHMFGLNDEQCVLERNFICEKQYFI